MREPNHYQLLVDMAKQCYNDALFAGTSGNLSIYDPETGVMSITPTSISYSTMTVEDVVSMKLDGTVLSGRHNPSSEWRMHAHVYQNRLDVSAIVHTHSPYATSFAVTHEEIPVILIEMVPFLGGAVPVSAFALPGTVEVGERALDVMAERNACLMANHGVLAIGATLQQAFLRAVYVEDAAKIYALALAHAPVSLISEENIRAMKERKQQPRKEGKNT